ncbi:MAG: cobalt ECF transporter T component CbiQ [Lachnospiraceae bacterium]
MNKAQMAGAELRAMDELANGHSALHQIAALPKLLLTVLYIVLVVSFHKYDLTGLFPMILFPLMGYQVAQIPVRTCFYKLRIVLPLVCAVGLFNPFFDKTVLLHMGSVAVTGGVISMLTLMMKGILTLMASFLLVATTGMERICGALRKLHMPKLLTSLLLLTYRYISVLLEEVSVMTTAYQLRAPGQKGIHISSWGSFLGQLILRSMDRAEALYGSMVVRGFHGEFHYADKEQAGKKCWLCAFLIAILMLLFRAVNVSAWLGSFMV